MGPTVIAYRLLQPVKERRTSTTSGFCPRSATGAATLFAFCVRGDSPLARDEADGPRATCFGRAHPEPVFARKGLTNPIMNPAIHLDDALRRRLPVALAAWAEGPSEGFTRLGCCANSPPQHPSCTQSSPVRSARGLEGPRVR